jgi:hypothetical protein
LTDVSVTFVAEMTSIQVDGIRSDLIAAANGSSRVSAELHLIISLGATSLMAI